MSVSQEALASSALSASARMGSAGKAASEAFFGGGGGSGFLGLVVQRCRIGFRV